MIDSGCSSHVSLGLVTGGGKLISGVYVLPSNNRWRGPWTAYVSAPGAQEDICAPASLRWRFWAAPQLHRLVKIFLISVSSGLLARAMKDRLRNSNRPLASAWHSGPRVSRALTPRSLGSDCRSKVDQVLRAPV